MSDFDVRPHMHMRVCVCVCVCADTGIQHVFRTDAFSEPIG